MAYRLKRLDPFWYTHPMIPTAVAIGGILGFIGFYAQKPIIAGLGALIAGGALLAAAKPVISALLGTLGLFGGVVTFVLVPNINAAGMGLGMRFVSTILFALFYMVLMDALVLVIAVLYNFFSGVLGLGGVGLEFEGVEEEEPAA
ncbi:MAG: hypothetical protein A3J74_06045 [Elusimicrobia bacterium RIFCSPHIGHO2_02_FULL_57_9]|nr:MAG: hypothetical protein A3J74_06045 [Elusimicrobia bacterium RIFCSPHIGHO2_02_FULL_57_9]